MIFIENVKYTHTLVTEDIYSFRYILTGGNITDIFIHLFLNLIPNKRIIFRTFHTRHKNNIAMVICVVRASTKHLPNDFYDRF